MRQEPSPCRIAIVGMICVEVFSLRLASSSQIVVGCQQISVMEPRIQEMRDSMPKAIAIPSHDWGVEGLLDHALPNAFNLPAALQ